MISNKIIRQQFIDFFISKGHAFVSSSSVVPIDDPTLLFTNAGMNQFKDIFLGIKDSEIPSAVNSQKCIRAGGKHNDLDEVGRDGYHHTFFEMLGNWSFGDYYKKEAIQWAWELFTEIWKLPKDKLHATVHHTDDEALELWKEVTDINPNHITKHGDKDNFWEMGETGPCGPCSEIHIDRGEEFCNLKNTEGHECKVNGDCHRYIELWNLVFMQYQRNEDRSLTPLKNKFVDTGAGFERVCQVLQNVNSNYDTDVFQPIIKEIVKISGIAYSEETGVSHRVIADHIRTLSFAIADGGMPSNEGRGYVLRRILRRAARYGRNLDLKDPFLYKLVDSLVENMGEHFEELKARADFIKTIIKNEEERFNQTLDKGLSLFEELIKNLEGTVISGKDAFMLYDTYGFPLDLTKILAEENNFTIDEEAFNKEMEKQKQRAREASNFKLQFEEVQWISLRDDSLNKFLGYEVNSCNTHIVKYAHINDTEVKIILDQTPFYAESGGQVADKGRLHNDFTEIQIFNVQKEGDNFVHYGKILRGRIDNTPYIAMIDAEMRLSTARNHTATHLLHSALKTVLGEHVQQKGSLVNADALRFDFTHFSAMTFDEIQLVERIVNEQIRDCTELKIEIKSIDEAKKDGATALFGEKYGETVRVISVGSFSKELCGGTHVNNTGQLGCFKILSESSSAAGIRRLEAITAINTEQYFEENENLLHNVFKILSANKNNIIEKLEKLIYDNKKQERDIEILKAQNSAGLLDELISKKHSENSIDFVYGLVHATKVEELKTMGDLLKEKLKAGIGVLVAEIDEKVSIIVIVTKELTKKIQAGKIVGELSLIVDGKGGGRPDMAMAGGKSTEKVNELLQQIPVIITKYINS